MTQEKQNSDALAALRYCIETISKSCGNDEEKAVWSDGNFGNNPLTLAKLKNILTELERAQAMRSENQLYEKEIQELHDELDYWKKRIKQYLSDSPTIKPQVTDHMQAQLDIVIELLEDSYGYDRDALPDAVNILKEIRNASRTD